MARKSFPIYLNEDQKEAAKQKGVEDDRGISSAICQLVQIVFVDNNISLAELRHIISKVKK